MAQKTNSAKDETLLLLQKLVIIELAREGVPQKDIAKILGTNIVNVNSIVKLFNSNRKR
jgi:transcriptional regulator